MLPGFLFQSFHQMKNKIKVKVNNLKLAKLISRIIFKNIPMSEKTVRDITKYTRKSKHKNILD